MENSEVKFFASFEEAVQYAGGLILVDELAVPDNDAMKFAVVTSPREAFMMSRNGWNIASEQFYVATRWQAIEHPCSCECDS